MSNDLWDDFCRVKDGKRPIGLFVGEKRIDVTDAKVVSGYGHFLDVCQVQILCDLGETATEQMVNHLHSRGLKNAQGILATGELLRTAIPFYQGTMTFLKAITAVEDWQGFCAVRILRDGTSPGLLERLDELPEAPEPNPYLPIAIMKERRRRGNLSEAAPR
jgi:hypothetical protein